MALLKDRLQGRLADLQSEEARAQAAHYSRVAEDAGIVHPREAREWPT